MFPIERERTHARQWLVVEIGDAGIEIERIEAALNLGRGVGQNLDRRARMGFGKRLGQPVYERQSDRNDADLELAGHAFPQAAEFLGKALIVGGDTLRPGQHAFALLSKTDEAVPTLDNEHAERLFDLFDAGRKRRLGYVGGRRRTGKMPLARQGRQILELPDQHGGKIGGRAGYHNENR
jgi:hypothetical protein